MSTEDDIQAYLAAAARVGPGDAEDARAEGREIRWRELQERTEEWLEIVGESGGEALASLLGLHLAQADVLVDALEAFTQGWLERGSRASGAVFDGTGTDEDVDMALLAQDTVAAAHGVAGSMREAMALLTENMLEALQPFADRYAERHLEE